MGKLKDSYKKVVKELKKVDTEERRLTADLIKSPRRAYKIQKAVSLIGRNACKHCLRKIRKHPLNTVDTVLKCEICQTNKDIQQGIKEVTKIINKEVDK